MSFHHFARFHTDSDQLVTKVTTACQLRGGDLMPSFAIKREASVPACVGETLTDDEGVVIDSIRPRVRG
jgi:hypothetical protein